MLLYTDPTTPIPEREPLPQTAWNDTAAPLPKVAGVHELVEAQVERTPGAVAAELEGESLPYRELNERANRIAHRPSPIACARSAWGPRCWSGSA